ncbi:MAG TPA: UvrD-helicase domain-containing protein [Terracidiphilus sp.]|nr:UvrD-helicase domain-containing protein [Terracidiphilus sp.]
MPEPTLSAPPDQHQREQALDPTRSVMVQAPAGSGKTDLLTRRFLRLLSEVDDPSQIVAITFTRAAAAEMRNRILEKLEKAALSTEPLPVDQFAMESLAARALERSRRLGWNLPDLPSLLRISTIDSFCAEIAARQPLLSQLGSGLQISENPTEIYRRAARATLMQLGSQEARASNPELAGAIALLLDWRDNNWNEIESHLVAMLAKRDRWMLDFVLSPAQDWELLRERLERPFVRAVAAGLNQLAGILAAIPDACDEILDLAQFACTQTGGALHRQLAELAELPRGPFVERGDVEDARQVFLCLADFLLTAEHALRQRFIAGMGFPADRKREKLRMEVLVRVLAGVPGFEAALKAIRALPPARYTDEEWSIVRASFTLLHHAAAQLQVAFAEAGTADFIEVAQAARRVLQDEAGQPTDSAFAFADSIRHLLVDEFQDTSRRQHELIGALVSAWTDPVGRTLFLVGDPMQSIYFFRDADAELFPRVQSIGLELPDGERHPLNDVRLISNFRTAPELVNALNDVFHSAFAIEDGSGIRFAASEPARSSSAPPGAGVELHVEFAPQIPRSRRDDPDSAQSKEEAADARDRSSAAQIGEIVALIREHLDRAAQARAGSHNYRIAVLGRTKASLTPIAQALRENAVPFRAIELEPLAMRPEVLDTLALARALYYPEDRVAWLGVLRAPWCGLSLADLHAIAGDSGSDRRPIPDLVRERGHCLSEEGRAGVARLLAAFDAAPALRSALPASALGTWLEQTWLSIGGAACVDAEARSNLDMLWRSLDALPGGEPDLLGSGLGAALKELNAQADPETDADCGVQLMTIHKSKGLEFEVVIVPDLQAATRKTNHTMLSWLERGLAQPDDSGEITEFLIAPFQPKGTDRSEGKRWVDREYRNRERQEMRRIFYVAATRAREELHLFTRVEFNRNTGAICDPSESLLQVAWPALEQQIRAQYASYQADREEPQVAEIAASATLVEMPSPAMHAVVRRLPPDYRPPPHLRRQAAPAGTGSAALFSRHEGGMKSRALGTAIHALLQELARLRSSHSWDDAHAALTAFVPRIVAQARSTGVDPATAEQLVQRAVEIAGNAARDPAGAWILSPHAEAASEARWSGVVSGAIHTVQVDRVFLAGAAPQTEGRDVWWIIDYKSAHPDALNDPEALTRLRPLFAPQLEIYAEVLRGLYGQHIAIRAGLYYPRLLAFDWWELQKCAAAVTAPAPFPPGSP